MSCPHACLLWLALIMALHAISCPLSALGLSRGLPRSRVCPVPVAGAPPRAEAARRSGLKRRRSVKRLPRAPLRERTGMCSVVDLAVGCCGLVRYAGCGLRAPRVAVGRRGAPAPTHGDANARETESERVRERCASERCAPTARRPTGARPRRRARDAREPSASHGWRHRDSARHTATHTHLYYPLH